MHRTNIALLGAAIVVLFVGDFSQERAIDLFLVLLAAEGVVDAELFAVVVGMSILTTLVAPFVLRRLARPSAPPPTSS